MRAHRPSPPRGDEDPASPPTPPPQSHRYKLIIGRCISFARYIGLIMVVFLATPVGMPQELGLNLGSSLWSLNISTSHSKLITIEYLHINLLWSFDGELALSRPSLVSTFTEGPDCPTSVRTKAQSMLAIVTDLGVNSQVSMLKGGEVTIHVAVKAERRLLSGPWWVAVFNVNVSCTRLTFTAPTDSEGGGNWMIFRGTLNYSLDIIPQP